jgi:hypothetical protein
MNVNHYNPRHSEAVVERVHELTWALLDEQIRADDKALLETLLLSSNEARKAYIECVQLHVDLAAHHAAEAAAAKPAVPQTSPILGFLSAGMPPFGFELNK